MARCKIVVGSEALRADVVPSQPPTSVRFDYRKSRAFKLISRQLLGVTCLINPIHFCDQFPALS